MVYSPHPPYEVLQTKLLDFATIHELRRFAKFWDTIANSGNFVETVPMLWADRLVPSPPSSGERDRVRGPNGDEATNHEQTSDSVASRPSTNRSLIEVHTDTLSEEPLTLTLSPQGRGEGTNAHFHRSPFADFRRLTAWLFAREGHSHGIALSRMVELLFEYLTTERGVAPELIAATIWRDYQRGGRSDKPACLRPFIGESPSAEGVRPTKSEHSPRRQSRHIAVQTTLGADLRD
jgi:hypothetical protein